MRYRSRSRIVAAAICGAFACSSCATLFSSSTVTVQMNSDPPGANYQIGAFSGKTPDSIAIPKKSIPDFATFEKTGYERRTVPVVSGITGVFWLDILFWPAILVDMVTGDYKTLDVTEISANLAPTTPAPAASTSPAAAVSTTAAVASDHK